MSKTPRDNSMSRYESSTSLAKIDESQNNMRVTDTRLLDSSATTNVQLLRNRAHPDASTTISSISASRRMAAMSSVAEIDEQEQNGHSDVDEQRYSRRTRRNPEGFQAVRSRSNSPVPRERNTRVNLGSNGRRRREQKQSSSTLAGAAGSCNTSIEGVVVSVDSMSAAGAAAGVGTHATPNSERGGTCTSGSAGLLPPPPPSPPLSEDDESSDCDGGSRRRSRSLERGGRDTMSSDAKQNPLASA